MTRIIPNFLVRLLSFVITLAEVGKKKHIAQNGKI